LEIDQPKIRVGGIGIKDFLPAREPYFLLYNGQVKVVSEVIDDPAKGVKANKVLPSIRRNTAERESEIRLRLAGDLGSSGIGRH
jgi:hypothetical protein